MVRRWLMCIACIVKCFKLKLLIDFHSIFFNFYQFSFCNDRYYSQLNEAKIWIDFVYSMNFNLVSFQLRSLQQLVFFFLILFFYFLIVFLNSSFILILHFSLIRSHRFPLNRYSNHLVKYLPLIRFELNHFRINWIEQSFFIEPNWAISVSNEI